MHIISRFLYHWRDSTLGQASGDWVTGSFWRPADFPSVFNDVFDHVGTEHAGALGNNHLTVWLFIEFDSDFDTVIGAAFGPAVLEIVETVHFAFLDGERLHAAAYCSWGIR